MLKDDLINLLKLIKDNNIKDYKEILEMDESVLKKLSKVDSKQFKLALFYSKNPDDYNVLNNLIYLLSSEYIMHSLNERMNNNMRMPKNRDIAIMANSKELFKAEACYKIFENDNVDEETIEKYMDIINDKSTNLAVVLYLPKLLSNEVLRKYNPSFMDAAVKEWLNYNGNLLSAKYSYIILTNENAIKNHVDIYGSRVVKKLKSEYRMKEFIDILTNDYVKNVNIERVGWLFENLCTNYSVQVLAMFLKSAKIYEVGLSNCLMEMVANYRIDNESDVKILASVYEKVDLNHITEYLSIMQRILIISANNGTIDDDFVNEYINSYNKWVEEKSEDKNPIIEVNENKELDILINSLYNISEEHVAALDLIRKKNIE